MIKVCMVVHQYYHRDGRVQRYADGLAMAGVQVDVLCPREPNRALVEQQGNIRIFTIPLGRGYNQRGSYLIEYGVALVLFTIQLLLLHIKNRYNVIHVHNMPDFLIFAALLPKIFGVKLILDIHDPMPEFYMSKFESHTGSRAVQLMCFQEKYSAKMADAIITTNTNFKENLIKRGIPSNKITVVNNIADPIIFNRKKYQQKDVVENDDFTLIYPGTIAPRYGLDVAVRALPFLISKIPQLRLLIIGSQVDFAHDLSALAKQLGVLDFVELKPIIPINEVPIHIIKADIGIYPALPDHHMNIATPTKVLEYAAMGVPIVASRLKILEDLFPDTALMFFEPGNVDQFARCIIELYENPNLRSELVQNADRVFVRNYSWQNEENKYFQLLNQLLSVTESYIDLVETNESSVKNTHIE